MRQKSDYREDFDPTRDQAEEVIAYARQFLAEADRAWGEIKSDGRNLAGGSGQAIEE